MKKRAWLIGSVFSLLMVHPVIGHLVTGQAFAWSPPNVGKACVAQGGEGQAYSMVAGNYLGGKAIHDGVVDRLSFQNCFEDEQTCTAWLAELAITHPIQPGFARCSRVMLR